jgi:Glycosyl hydrolase catalytic core
VNPHKRTLPLLVVVAVLAAIPVARMPVGFFDDPSFRWSPAVGANLDAAAAAHASVVRTLVDWATVAPTRPVHPLNGDDPAYHLSDIDALVVTALRYDLRVLLTISGTPPWANGGKSPNHPPTNLNNLTQFAQMLAARYNGSRPGAGVVTLFSVWNEPNLGEYLTPQFAGDKIVSPAEYVKLFLAAYSGIKRGDPDAVVAAGETSNRGLNEPTGGPGGGSVAPATFAELVAKADPKLPLVAWATHPLPTSYQLGPAAKVAFPDVGFSTMSRFGSDLTKWFKRPVPIWVTEYGEQTTPEYRFGGVSYAVQAQHAKQALQLAEASPYVQMFVWFVFRDSNDQTWFSGLEQASGRKKPAYAAFASTAAGIVGQSQMIASGHPFNVTLAVPFIAWHDAAGSALGVTYVMKMGTSTVVTGQPQVTLARDETVTFQVRFTPVKHQAYTLSVTVEDKHGQSESHEIALIPDS